MDFGFFFLLVRGAFALTRYGGNKEGTARAGVFFAVCAQRPASVVFYDSSYFRVFVCRCCGAEISPEADTGGLGFTY